MAILTLSIGAVYAIAAQPQYQQGGPFAGMTGGSGYGGGMMGGLTGNPGSMMAGQGGMMGQFSQMKNGYANMMSSAGSMMGRYGGMMSQMVQHMAGFGSQTSNGSESGLFLAIIDYTFHPSTITIPRGTTVTWVNMDFVQHTVTSGTEQAPTGLFDSNPLSHMQSFSYTFNAPGTYSYYCDLHPNMTGTIRVTG